MVPSDWSVSSAGSVPTAVRPQAIAVMAEIGIDLSAHTSKSVSDIEAHSVDVVITLCAEEACPVGLEAARRLHWPIADPAGYSNELEQAQLERFRRARDAIRLRLVDFLASELA